jgi:hypothetical protein
LGGGGGVPLPAQRRADHPPRRPRAARLKPQGGGTLCAHLGAHAREGAGRVVCELDEPRGGARAERRIEERRGGLADSLARDLLHASQLLRTAPAPLLLWRRMTSALISLARNQFAAERHVRFMTTSRNVEKAETGEAGDLHARRAHGLELRLRPRELRLGAPARGVGLSPVRARDSVTARGGRARQRRGARPAAACFPRELRGGLGRTPRGGAPPSR